MLELYYDEYKTFRNINHLNEDIANGVPWEMVGVSWTDVEVTGDDGKERVYHNPVMLVGRRYDDDRDAELSN